MAIIYTYPVKATPVGDDLILISDSADSNKTKQIKVSSLPSSGAGITLTTTGTSGVATLTGSVLNIPNYTTTGGTPATPLNSVQFNNASAFGGSSKLIYIDSTRTLTVGVQDVSSGILFIGGGQNEGSPVSGQLKLGDNGTSGGVVTLKAAADISSGDYDIVLPSLAPGGNNKILQSDASGNLSWITTPTGTTYSAGTGLALNGTTFSLASGASLTNLGGGSGATFLRKDGTWATPGDDNTNIANSNLQLDNNRNLDLSNSDAADYALTFISTLGGASKNLFKFDQIGGTSPRFAVGHSESAYEGYVVLEGNGSNRTGILQFENSAGTYYTSFQAPPTFAANQNIGYVLPNLQGTANSVLTNNGSGTLSWGSAAIVEEGTWTPSAYVPAGSAPTTSTAVGSYIKIGDLVNCYFYLNVTSTSGGNVPMIISGLPFSASNTNGYRGMVSISRNDGTNFPQQQATSGLVTGNSVTLKRPDIQATNPSGTTVSITNTETINASWFASASLNYILEGTIIFKV